MASYLPYFNVEVRSVDFPDLERLKKKHGGRIPQVVQLLGSSGWHHPSLIPRGGHAVEGALFLDVYSGGEAEEYATEEAARFAEVCKERVGRAPSRVAAQAYDAGLLAFAARAAALRADTGVDVDARAAVAAALARARIDIGACGPAAMSPSGELTRDPVVLRVDGGDFVLHVW